MEIKTVSQTENLLSFFQVSVSISLVLTSYLTALQCFVITDKKGLPQACETDIK